jgi:hypothetical protein
MYGSDQEILESTKYSTKFSRGLERVAEFGTQNCIGEAAESLG